MAFVLSSGTIRSLSRASYSAPQRIQLSDSFAADYFQIWRTQDSVRTVVSFLARNIAQLGLPLYKRKGDADRERMHDHELAKLLRRPNPWTTGYRFRNALVHDLAIYDNAYLVKSKVDGQTRSLIRMPPSMVTPEGDNWLTPEYFKVNGKKDIPADDMVYLRGYGGEADEGVSPLEALRRTLREEWAGSEMREQIMRNGARASGYIERPAPGSTTGTPEWSSTARDRFKEDWRAQYTGQGPEAGGTPILEDGMKFVEASQTARELQYVEGRKLTREEVATAYHVSPPMVGILDKATFSNITELHKMLYQDTLGPWLQMIQEDIALQLIPDFEANPDDFYVEFNLQAKLAGSFEERATSMQASVGAPWMTRNEARALDNRPPIEGGDELIQPLNVTQNGDQDPVPADDGGGSGGLTPTGDEDPADDDEDQDDDEKDED